MFGSGLSKQSYLDSDESYRKSDNFYVDISLMGLTDYGDNYSAEYLKHVIY